jgi:hypothetical protein
VPFTNLKPIPNQQLVLSFAVPFTSLSIRAKMLGQNHFAETGFDFSSFNFLSQGHTLSLTGAALSSQFHLSVTMPANSPSNYS